MEIPENNASSPIHKSRLVRLKKYAIEEFKKSPIATTMSMAGPLTALFTLIFAWIQGPDLPSINPTIASNTLQNPSETNIKNILILVSFFLSSTTSCALVVKLFARKHGAGAYFLSIPLTALNNFITILVIYLAPPRPVDSQFFSSAHELIRYASVAIFAAIFGMSLLTSVFSSHNDEANAESNDLGKLMFVFFLAFIWSWLVFNGQIRLTQTLLPPQTHYLEFTKN